MIHRERELKTGEGSPFPSIDMSTNKTKQTYVSTFRIQLTSSTQSQDNSASRRVLENGPAVRNATFKSRMGEKSVSGMDNHWWLPVRLVSV